MSYKNEICRRHVNCLFLILVLVFFFFSCTSGDKRIFEEISWEQWRKISDTSCYGLNGTFVWETQNQGIGHTNFDWSEALSELKAYSEGGDNAVLQRQANDLNVFYEKIGQEAIHEKDRTSFGILLDSLLQELGFSIQEVDTLKNRILNLYIGDELFTESNPTAVRTFHIRENDIDYFIEFTIQLFHTGRFDKLSKGSCIVESNGTGTRFIHWVYVGNLAFEARYESYAIASSDIAAWARYKVKHKCLSTNKIYYRQNSFKMPSSILQSTLPPRRYKVLMSSIERDL